ncbi:MAG: FixH family protein [Thermaurantimonas sp.]
MKLNWGWYIVFALIGFAVFILYHVYGMMRQNTDLITENYYNEELVYQERIEEKQRVLNENKALKINYDATHIYILLPFDGVFEAEINFIHPERQIFDKSYTVKDSLVTLSRSELKPGKWLLKCLVHSDGKKYLFEETLFL